MAFRMGIGGSDFENQLFRIAERLGNASSRPVTRPAPKPAFRRGFSDSGSGEFTATTRPVAPPDAPWQHGVSPRPRLRG